MYLKSSNDYRPPYIICIGLTELGLWHGNALACESAQEEV